VSDPLRYLVVIEHSEGTGHSAWAPDLPGCVTAAETREEREQLMREAIGHHLAGLRQDGEPNPSPPPSAPPWSRSPRPDPSWKGRARGRG
jgi:predicted RNase H-like HicB family nuclease